MSFHPMEQRHTAVGVALAVLGGIARALWGIGIPTDPIRLRPFTGEVVVTSMALAWWQLVGYVILSLEREPRMCPAQPISDTGPILPPPYNSCFAAES